MNHTQPASTPELILNKYRNEYDRAVWHGELKYAHPEVQYRWNAHMPAPGTPFDMSPIKDMSVSREERIRRRTEYLKLFGDGPCLVDKETAAKFVIKELDVPGCPEEPDTTSHVRVFIPPIQPEAGKTLNCIFYICSGGLICCLDKLDDMRAWAMRYNAVIVQPIYRTSIDAPYPAAVNDLHAAWKWTYENAAELNIDPEHIIMFGSSSGGHMGSVLPFRLKRYGYRPAASIIHCPILEDRPVYYSMRLNDCTWDGVGLLESNKLYMQENYGSPFLGPEAYANRATVDECRGLCPYFIFTEGEDPECDPCLAFATKLREANVFTEVHVFAGLQHGGWLGAAMDCYPNPAAKRAYAMLAGCIDDALQYDLRRD